MTRYLFACAALIWAVPLAVTAQERPVSGAAAAGASDGWAVAIGAGALLSPNYLGDDAYSISIVPSVRITHGERFVASVQEGVGYKFINQKTFRAGPLLTLDFGRDEDGGGPFRIVGKKTDDLIGLGDIDTTVSVGGFAEYDFGNLTASAKIGQAIGGHDGLTGELGLSYKGVKRWNGPPVIYTLGPRLNFGDSQYVDTYFGVDNMQSTASGLSTFSASGGLVSYGVAATAIVPLTDAAALTLISSYNRLTADAANSPLVRERGSREQAFLGVVASYTFD